MICTVIVCISADWCILWQAWTRFYSSPRLPKWPIQRQISQKRALIPTRLVESIYCVVCQCLIVQKPAAEVSSRFSHFSINNFFFVKKIILERFPEVSRQSIIDGPHGIPLELKLFYDKCHLNSISRFSIPCQLYQLEKNLVRAT